MYNTLIWEQNFGKGTSGLKEWNIRLGNDLLDDNGNAVVPGWGNGEAQFYTGHDKNLYIDESGLNLCARLQTTEVDSDSDAHLQTTEVDSDSDAHLQTTEVDSDSDAHLQTTEVDNSPYAQPQSHELIGRRFLYTSARLDTRDHFSFCYGKLVVRAKLPVGHGLWPAIWMLPQTREHGPWPASGEIDVCEAKGRLPRHIFGTLHHGKDFESKITDEFSHELPSGSIAEFRDYSLEWSPDSIRWLVDGHCFAERKLEHGSAPFDVPFYLVLNLAVGGWYDQVEVDESALPAVMTVAGIWVYQ
ncbi:glycoside hydrolase family 16 protein [Paenibacillus sp. CAU 1782]